MVYIFSVAFSQSDLYFLCWILRSFTFCLLFVISISSCVLYAFVHINQIHHGDGKLVWILYGLHCFNKIIIGFVSGVWCDLIFFFSVILCKLSWWRMREGGISHSLCIPNGNESGEHDDEWMIEFVRIIKCIASIWQLQLRS